MATGSPWDSFLSCIQTSELIAGPILRAYLETLGFPGTSEWHPRKLASRMIRDGLLTRWQARQLLLGRQRGFVLNGKYRILEVLGQGGGGRVYLCEHMTMRRPVAVKVLVLGKILQDAGAVERFHREARAAASLNHPNIVRAFDLDRDTKRYFLVMEFVDGVNLHDLVQKQGPLDVVRAAHAIAQAASGLEHAHTAGWIHRDVKPGNLLIDRLGVVRLLDLGLAVATPNGPASRTVNFAEAGVLGTVDYLSPEQAQNVSDLDLRTDIYSLGATFYYLLTGFPPFPEDTLARKLLLLQTTPPLPLRQRRPEVLKEMADLVDRMMSRDRNERPSTLTEVVAALTPWTSTPVPVPRPLEIPRRVPLVARILKQQATPPVPPSSGFVVSIPAPPSNHPRPSHNPAVASVSGSERRSWAFRVVLVAIILMGGLLAWFTWIRETLPIESINPPDDPYALAPVLRQSVDGNQAIHQNLGEAVAAAEPGDTLLVRGNITESIRITGERCRNLTLVADKRPISWSSKDQETDPLLDITDVQGVRVQGPFVFEGTVGQLKVLRIMGECPGTHLQGLEFRGAEWCYIQLWNGYGTSLAPITISECRFRSKRDREAVGIHLEGGSGEPGRQVAHVALIDCQFEGPFSQGCIHLKEEVRELLLRGNRFRGAKEVLHVHPGTEYGQQALLANNTIHDCETVLGFETEPGPRVDLALLNNLFSNVSRDVSLQSRNWRPATPSLRLFQSGNRSLGAMEQEGNSLLSLKRIEGPLPFSLESPGSREWLTYPTDHPLSKAGAAGQAVGAPRTISDTSEELAYFASFESKPFRHELSAKNATYSAGTVPELLRHPWTCDIWDNQSAGEWSSETWAGSKGYGFRNLRGLASIQFCPEVPLLLLSPETTYHIDLEYLTQGRPVAELRLEEERYPKTLSSHRLPLTSGAWRHYKALVRPERVTPLTLTLQNQVMGKEHLLAVRSLKITRSRAAPQRTFIGHWAPKSPSAPMTRLQYQKGLARMQALPGMPPWAFHAQNPEGGAEVFVERVSEHNCITLRNLEGPPTAALVTPDPIGIAPAGIVTVVRLEYRTDPRVKKNVCGWVWLFPQLRDGSIRASGFLTSTDGAWRTVEVAMMPSEAMPLCVVIPNELTGEANALSVRSISVFQEGKPPQ